MDKPLNPMDKQLIAARFAKARNTYTREARVQQQVAEKMMQLIKEPYTRFRRVVEFGCGTGSYSRILLHTLQPEALLLNDLCREMEECVKELCDGTTVQFVPGDAEAIDFPGETDLITSCSTLQWFNDPGAFFTRATKHWWQTAPACLQHLRRHKHARNTPTDWARAGLSLR